MASDNDEFGWIIKCPSCGLELEVLEEHIKIDKKGRAYITCPNNEGHKKNRAYSFTISNKKIIGDPELLKVVDKKRKSLGFASLMGDKEIEETGPHRDGPIIMRRPPLPEYEEEEKEEEYEDEEDEKYGLRLDMSDEEIFSIIRKNGRPALDRLKRMHLKKILEVGGMPRIILQDLLDDFDLYSELRNNPQSLYQAIKWHLPNLREPLVPEFYIQKAVRKMMELEQDYGRADQPVFVYPVNPYFPGSQATYTTWNENMPSHRPHIDAEVLKAWKKELEESEDEEE